MSRLLHKYMYNEQWEKCDSNNYSCNDFIDSEVLSFCFDNILYSC